MPFRIFQVQQGTPIAATSTIQLLPSGLTGTRGALRRLVHPDGATFPPALYWRNPDRIFNFDADVLRAPIVEVVRTLSASRTIRFEEIEEDVLITEVWTADSGISMPLFMLRWLYELVLNPPAFDALNQEYVRWEPRDRTDDAWHVQLLRLQVGGGNPGTFDVAHRTAGGGPNDPSAPGDVLAPTDVLEVSPTAFLDRPVSLTMRVIEKAPA